MWCNPKIAFQVTYRIKRGTLWLCRAMDKFQTTNQELCGQKEENTEVEQIFMSSTLDLQRKTVQSEVTRPFIQKRTTI